MATVIATQDLVVGRTTYALEIFENEHYSGVGTYESIFLTGPRGAELQMVPYVGSDVYHAFRCSGSHADLKNTKTGLVARFTREGNTFSLI